MPGRRRAARRASRRRRLLSLPCLLSLFVLPALLLLRPGGEAAGQDVGQPAGSEDRETYTLVDVPYLPQGPDLCGGAAAAMVMRYWGEEGVDPEAFRPLVDDSEAGIRTDRLAEELRGRGWWAEPTAGDLDFVAHHLDRGRPVMALLRVGPERFHYVVVVGMIEDVVIFHDPATAPFQQASRSGFRERWEPAGFWSLVLLPGAEGDGEGEEVAPGSPAPGEPDAPEDVCRALHDAAAGAAAAGQLDLTETLLDRGLEACPGSADLRSALAGLRVRQERWEEAEDEALRATALQEDHEGSLRILAATRFVRGDHPGALEAWNRLGEPTVSEVQAYGLRRVRYREIRTQLGLREGRVLTPGSLAAAGRRAAAVPALRSARVSYRAPRQGRTVVELFALERPLVVEGPLEAAVRAVSWLPRREITVEVSSPLGAGEKLAAGWRWESGRSRIGGSLDAPGFLGIPGVWSVEGEWARRTFEPPVPEEGTGATTGGPGGAVPGNAVEPLRQERARARLAWARWTGAGTLVRASAGTDRWPEAGTYAAMVLGVERRASGDRVAGRAVLRGWTGPRAEGGGVAGGVEAAGPARIGPRFGGASVRGAWRSTERARPWAVRARAGLDALSSATPRTEWPEAGTGNASPAFLRAHPVLEDGAVRADAVTGRRLAHGTVELQFLPLELAPARGGISLFVDAARAWSGPGGEGRGPLVDGGLGLVLAPGPDAGELRLDAAVGLVDGASALSVTWLAPWPSWR